MSPLQGSNIAAQESKTTYWGYQKKHGTLEREEAKFQFEKILRDSSVKQAEICISSMCIFILLYKFVVENWLRPLKYTFFVKISRFPGN